MFIERGDIVIVEKTGSIYDGLLGAVSGLVPGRDDMWQVLLIEGRYLGRVVPLRESHLRVDFLPEIRRGAK